MKGNQFIYNPTVNNPNGSYWFTFDPNTGNQNGSYSAYTAPNSRYAFFNFTLEAYEDVANAYETNGDQQPARTKVKAVSCKYILKSSDVVTCNTVVLNDPTQSTPYSFGAEVRVNGIVTCTLYNSVNYYNSCFKDSCSMVPGYSAAHGFAFSWYATEYDNI